MKLPKGQIARAGRVSFGDASVSVCEEGISAARATGGHEGVKAWELQFKREVFTRVVQTLRHIGWDCAMPPIDPHSVKHYGGDVARWSAQRKRDCSKGDLKGELEISGRSISFKMWQGVNTPTRPDHGGKYEHDLEGCMPYMLRIEMERTRRRIRNYLCNVFTDYTFDSKHRSIYNKPMQFTAIERIHQHYAESCHFKGDWALQLEKYSSPGMVGCFNSNRKSNDNVLLEHGQRVWFADYQGRICEGTAFYNINNMWWVVTGRYDYANKGCFEIYAKCPDNPRVKRNARQRRKKLESLLSKATAAMHFERAAKLRDILFQKNDAVFMIFHKEKDVFFGPNYCGYTTDTTQAGKYTQDELKPYLNGGLETECFKAIEIRASA